MAEGSLLGVSVLELRTDQTSLDKGLSTARGKTLSASQAMGASWDNVGKKVATVGNHMSTLGSRMTTNVTLPIVAGAAGAIKVFSDFEGALTQVETQAGASGREIANMRGELLKLAPAVGQTPTALANALFQIESSGLRGAKALDVLTQSAKLAAIGHSDLEQTAGAVVSIMKSAPKDVGNATQAIGLMNATVGAGRLRMQDLVGALSTGILPAAKAAGLGLQDVGAAIAVMTSRGIPANDAATRLRMTFSLMAAPTSQAAKALASVGIGSSELANDMRKPDGLVMAVEDLKKHMDDAGLSAVKQNQLIAQAFGGGRSSSAIETLLQNVGDLQSRFNQIGQHSGAQQVTAAWTETRKDTGFQLDQLKAEAEKAGIEIGQAIGPDLINIAKEVAGDASSIAHGFASLPKSTQDAILTGGLVLAGIGPALKLLGVFTTGVGRLYDVALIASKLASGKGFDAARTQGLVKGGSVGPTSVATMEVGTLIAKETVGGGGAIPTASGGKATLKAVEGDTETAAAGAGGATEAGLLSKLGSAGSRAVGVGGLALLAAPVGIALGEVVDKWIQNDALSEGRKWASQFTAPLPDAVKKNFADPLARARSQQLDQPLTTARGSVAAATAKGAPPSVRGRVPAADLQPTAKDLAQTQKNYFNEGYLAGRSTVSGLQSVRFTSAPILIRDFTSQLNKLPAQARPQAAKMMIEFAQGLEQQGKLPKHSLDGIIATLEQTFPQLGQFLARQGLLNDQTVAKAMKFTAASSQLKQTLSNYRTQFGDFSIATNLTGQNIDQNVARAMTNLRQSIASSTGSARKTYEDELGKLQDATNSTFDAMASKVSSQQAAMTRSIQNGSKQAAQTAGQNFDNFRNSVAQAMAAGVLATSKGSQLIADALNATLKAFGEKPLAVATVKTLSPAELGAVAKGKVSSGAAASPHAVGGLLQVGRAGERGRDTVPLNVGGTPIIVGRGEQVAVFNDSQQRVMNQRLADMGGLPGFFSKVNRPHYMAQGGMISDFSVGGSVSGATPATANTFGGSSVVEQMASSLLGHGMSKSGAAGVIGNAYQESTWNPASVGSGGAGLFGWTPPSKIPGYPSAGWSNVASQMNLLWSGDAASPGIASIAGRLSHETVPGATQDFMTNWERPLAATENYANRLKGAFMAFNLMKGMKGALGGLGAATLAQAIKAPGVKGTGTIATIVRAALGKAASAANSYEAAHQPQGSAASGPSIPGGGATSGPPGLAVFEGVTMAKWIANELVWATQHGWHGQPTSGYRTEAESAALGFPHDEHTLINYPGGAVDFGAMHGDPAALATKTALVELASRLNYPGPRLKMPIGFVNDGHLSGTGHSRGGLVDLLRAYAAGGYLGQVKTLPPGGGRLVDRMTIGSIDSAGNSGGFNQAGKGYALGTVPRGPVAGPWWAEGDRRASIGTSFGGKPGGQAARFTKGNRSTVAFKVDTGDGNSYGDIYPTANSAIGFNDNGPVKVDFLTDAAARKLLAGGKAAALAKAPKVPVPKPKKGKGLKGTSLPGALGIIGENGPFPFQTSDMGGLNNVLSTILQLDGGDSSGIGTGDKGDAQKMWDLVQWYTQNYWTSGMFPTPNFSSIGSPSDFVISQDANGNPIAPFISPNINEVAKQLAQAIGWQGRGVGDLQGTLSLSRGLGPMIRKAIQRRVQMVAKIRKRIQENVRKIKALQAKIKTENAKKNQSRAQAKVSALRVAEWNQTIGQLQSENQQLAGSKNAVGTGGELATITGQLGTSGATDALGTVLGSGGSETGLYQVQSTAQSWADTLGGTGGDVQQQKLTLSGFQGNLAGLLPGASTALQGALASATTSSASSGTADQLASLLQQQVTNLTLKNAVLTGQYKALSSLGSLPPFGGSFLQGGTVPGALGEPRTVIAHGQETILQAGESGGGNTFHVIVQDGAVDSRKIAVIANGEAQKVTRSAARGARTLPGARAGQLGGR